MFAYCTANIKITVAVAALFLKIQLSAKWAFPLVTFLSLFIPENSYELFLQFLYVHIFIVYNRL